MEKIAAINNTSINNDDDHDTTAKTGKQHKRMLSAYHKHVLLAQPIKTAGDRTATSSNHDTTAAKQPT